MASPGKVVVAAGLIIFRRISNDVHYLMLQASYGDHHWSPPKGHVDEGESEWQAAFRETEEEAGISQDQITLYDKFRSELHYEVRNRPKKVIYWLAELKNPNQELKLSHEHKDMKWLSFEDASDIAKYEDMRKALSDANDFISKL